MRIPIKNKIVILFLNELSELFLLLELLAWNSNLINIHFEEFFS
jgi:hypothetical protein